MSLGVDEVLMVIALILVVFIFVHWRGSIIHLGFKDTSKTINQLNEVGKNTLSSHSSSSITTGSYEIIIRNPVRGMVANTTLLGSGVQVKVIVNNPYKYTIEVIGYKKDGSPDMHISVVEMPPGTKYFSETFLVSDVSVAGYSWGFSKTANVKLDFLYRELGDSKIVIVVAKTV